MKVKEIIEKSLSTLEEIKKRSNNQNITSSEYSLLATLYWNDEKLTNSQIIEIYEYLIEFILKLLRNDELNTILREELEIHKLLNLLNELELIEEEN